jgi:hypothetical protein
LRRAEARSTCDTKVLRVAPCIEMEHDCPSLEQYNDRKSSGNERFDRSRGLLKTKPAFDRNVEISFSR